MSEPLQIPHEKRDQQWQHHFLQWLPQQKLRVLRPEPQEGPDGWPYLLVETGSEEGDPAAQIFAWLATRGIGLVINPQKAEPDFVFPYGVVWNFVATGQFYAPTSNRVSGHFTVQPGQEVRTGIPNDSLLPAHVRKVVKNFLVDQGVFNPKILAVSFDNYTFDLCFSIESLGVPPEKEHSGIAEALAWFFPAHYAISLVSEEKISGFVPL